MALSIFAVVPQYAERLCFQRRGVLGHDVAASFLYVDGEYDTARSQWFRDYVSTSVSKLQLYASVGVQDLPDIILGEIQK